MNDEQLRDKIAMLRLEVAGQVITIEAQQTVIRLQGEQLQKAEEIRLDTINHYEGKMEELTRFRDEWERVAHETREVFGKVTERAGWLIGNLDELLVSQRVTIPVGMKAILAANMLKLTEAIEGAHVEEPR